MGCAIDRWNRRGFVGGSSGSSCIANPPLSPSPFLPHLLPPIQRHDQHCDHRRVLPPVSVSVGLARRHVRIDPQGRQRPQRAPADFGQQGQVCDPQDALVLEEGAAGQAKVGGGEEDLGALLPVDVVVVVVYVGRWVGLGNGGGW